MISYKTQFDKLIEAYIKGEVNPWNDCACFVGNLLNKTRYWGTCRKSIGNFLSLKEYVRKSHLGSETALTKIYTRAIDSIVKEGDNTYTPQEIIKLEAVFMYRISENFDEDKEEALFAAFAEALDKLKEIHISKGENIEEQFTFKRRELLCAI